MYNIDHKTQQQIYSCSDGFTAIYLVLYSSEKNWCVESWKKSTEHKNIHMYSGITIIQKKPWLPPYKPTLLSEVPMKASNN